MYTNDNLIIHSHTHPNAVHIGWTTHARPLGSSQCRCFYIVLESKLPLPLTLPLSLPLFSSASSLFAHSCTSHFDILQPIYFKYHTYTYITACWRSEALRRSTLAFWCVAFVLGFMLTHRFVHLHAFLAQAKMHNHNSPGAVFHVLALLLLLWSAMQNAFIWTFVACFVVYFLWYTSIFQTTHTPHSPFSINKPINTIVVVFSHSVLY